MRLKLHTSEAERMLQRLRRAAMAKLRSAPVQAAKYLHKSVRNSIRISRRPSKPGKPPHSRKGVLKNAVASRVEYSDGRATVQVGFSREMGSKRSLANIAGLHEVGGAVPRADPFRVGMCGPIAKDEMRASRKYARSWLGRGFVFARLKTEAMARRANSLANAVRPATKSNYPPRPFLKPTLDKAKKAPRFLRIFSIK